MVIFVSTQLLLSSISFRILMMTNFIFIGFCFTFSSTFRIATSAYNGPSSKYETLNDLKNRGNTEKYNKDKREERTNEPNNTYTFSSLTLEMTIKIAFVPNEYNY